MFIGSLAAIYRKTWWVCQARQYRGGEGQGAERMERRAKKSRRGIKVLPAANLTIAELQ